MWSNVKSLIFRFTLERGSLNPMMALTVQIFAAFDKGNAILFPYCLFLIVGDLLGGFIGYQFFKKFYAPLK